MTKTVHIRTVAGGGASLGWTNGRSLTVDGGAAGGDAHIGFNADELLSFAIGASYTAHLWQEATKRQIRIKSLGVEISPEPPAGPGLSVSVTLEADVDEEAIMDLLERVDKAATTCNQLRLGVPVRVTNAHVIRSG
jgi:uncharacterized OsmC-like protein